MATWPCGSQSTAKMSAAGAAMVRWTSMRSLMDPIVSAKSATTSWFGSSGHSASWLTRPAKTVGSAVAAGTMRERTGAYALAFTRAAVSRR